MSTKVAYIGLGIMGNSMAGHLLAGGNELAVYTRTKSKAQNMLDKGARWVDSPAAAGRQAQVVFINVTDTPDVEQVVCGKDGLLTTAARGTIIVDNSTIAPAATRQMATAAAEKGVAFLDAPVSGGDIGARNATLAIMVGGDESAFAKVEPLLKLMGKTITHCGPSGAGQLTKAVNQILVACTNMAVSEALVFAQQNGLDLQKTITAVAGGGAGSWQLSNLGPRMAKGDFAPAFMIDLQQKDLRIVLNTAAESHTPLPATALVHQLFASLQAAGRGRDGTQALFTVLQKLAGATP